MSTLDKKEKEFSLVNKKLILRRQSNIELLRIISMILIVSHHFSLHGVLKNFGENALLQQSVTTILAQIIQLGGKVGVCLFILISGYFMVNAEVKLKKIFFLVLQVLFYSIGSLCFIKLLGATIELTDIIEAVFPVLHEQYWFVTAYVILYLISPFLNKLLLNLSKKEFQKMLLVTIFLWILVPTFTSGEMGSSNITRFILFYSIGSFIKLHSNKKYDNIKFGFILSLISYSLLVASVFIYNFIGRKLQINELISEATYFSNSSSLLVLAIAVGLFIWIKNINMGSINWINKVSGATFGIYLIHDNRHIRPILWHSIFRTQEHISDSPLFFVLYALYVVLVVLFVTIGIELLRLKYIHKYEVKILDVFLNHEYLKIITALKSIKFIKKIK